MADPIMVRMHMGLDMAAEISEILPRCPPEVAERLLLQLWLKGALCEQRRRIGVTALAGFDRRGDMVLALLDPQEPEGEPA